ncbi:hypothetical protein [Bacillus alveayuensis]|jgi:hypothetical protein|uniref:hypothetical protein n=1 Tax=Aeribacillus alveayuensis TaxID=279215 RepID=UPI000A5AE870|nr:hypothetical protein [Bacillus alveayuensis]
MTKKTAKNKEMGRTIPIPSDTLREEFGIETGDFNAYKVIELIEEVKRKKKN